MAPPGKKLETTLLNEAVDGNADSALEMKGIRRVLESQTVSSALRTPMVERRVGPCIFQVAGYGAVDDNL